MSCRPVTLSMFNFRFARHFEGDHTERLSGQREPFTADDIAEPNYEVYAFSLCRRPRVRDGLVPILVGRTVHHLREPKDRKGIFVRSGYSVRLAYVDDPEDPEDGEFLTGCYARVLHIRKWLLLIPLLIAALFLVLTLTLCGSGRSGIAFFEGQSRTSSERTKPIQQTDFASYTATPDTVTWRAGETRQDISLSLPANCSGDGKDGGNPVCSTVAIACDLDSNGKFDDSEIVWSATDPDSGSPLYIRPGFGINHIDLSKPLAAGEYRARTIWRSVLLDAPSTSAGSASFDWLLKVVE